VAARVVLRAYEGQFVRVTNSGGEMHIPPDGAPDTWEIFRRTDLGDDKIQLEAANSTAGRRLYLSAEGGGGDLVLARRVAAGDWETFTLVPAGAQVTLRAHNGEYLCAEGSGGDLLLANRPAAGDWERFDLVDLGGGRIALRAANGSYLRAEGGGGGRVVVNRDNRDQEVVRFEAANGVYLALRAANDRYWSAQGGGYGGAPVLATGTDPGGDWEKFALTNNADGTIALQAKEGRKYVQAEEGGGARVLANGDAIGIWEKFVRTPWYDRPRPRKLLVYRGAVGRVNGVAGDLARAGRVFSHYEYVILDNPADTRELLANIRWNTAGVTKVFGRLDIDEIETRAAAWAEAGADGIVIDGAGGGRWDAAITRVHDLGLTVVARAEDPAAVFGGEVTLADTDFYFLDGFAVRDGDYADWHTMSERLRAHQAEHEFRILSAAGGESFDQAKFDYAWHAAMLYGHEATGWTEGGDPDAAPYRRRPAVSPGYFTTPITTSGTAIERRTDAGIISVDPARHTAGIR
jgi:hypothetical protein